MVTEEEIRNMSVAELTEKGGFSCVCGKTHTSGTQHVIIGSGAINMLPSLLSEAGCGKPFLLSGHSTFEAAGNQVAAVLDQAGISYRSYVFPHSPVQPDEHSLGAALMYFDYSCDSIIGIGSGCINDIGKILARATGRKYIIVGTAPSMDGYASATSSMERDGLKISLDSTSAWAIVGDLDILCRAPLHMLQAGVGDMLAKYISLCEWKIANIVVGEDYCPVIAALVEASLERCIQAAPALIRREPDAVKAVMEGLSIAGIAMKYAGMSRPASGMEHYFSHIWDMRALAFGTKSDLHGIQCGAATLLSLKVYNYIRAVKPDREHALKAARSFSMEQWKQNLRDFIGPGALAMIEREKEEGKYALAGHARRIDTIIRRWDEILQVIDTLPAYEQVYDLLKSIGAPVSPAAFGISDAQVKVSFLMTKDIRDKYIGSRLLWDLGLLDKAAEALF